MKKILSILALLVSPMAMGAVSESDRALITPRNIMENPGFERSTTKWTASGGTFATTTTAANVGTGTAAGAWDSSAAAQTLTSSAVTIPAGMFGSNASMSCRIQTPSGTATHNIIAFDGTTELTSTAVPSSTSYTVVTTNFVMPSSGTIAVRLKSVNANEPNINIDDCIIGLAENIGSSQIDVPMVSYTPTFTGLGTPTGISCQHGRRSDHAIIRCTATSGTITATSVTVTLPTGLTVDTNKVSASNTIVGTLIFNASGANGTSTIYAVGGASTLGFGLQNATNNTGVSATNGTVWASTSLFSFYADVPITQYNEQTSYRADTYALSWSGYHTTASATWSRTNTAYGDPTNTGTPVLTERTNRNFGTVVTNASNLPGITFTPPRSGRYYVCGSPNMRTSGAANLAAGFRLWDGTTTITEGQISMELNGLVSQIALCGIYNAASGSSVDITLQSKVSANSVVIDGSNSSSSIEWSIFALDQGFPAPVLVGSVTSNSSVGERLERISFGGATEGTNVCTSTPCTIYRQSGSWVTSVTRNSTGIYTVNVAAGIFSSAPTCTMSVGGVVSDAFGFVAAASTTSSVVVKTASNGSFTATDGSVTLTCMGPK